MEYAAPVCPPGCGHNHWKICVAGQAFTPRGQGGSEFVGTLRSPPGVEKHSRELRDTPGVGVGFGVGVGAGAGAGWGAGAGAALGVGEARELPLPHETATNATAPISNALPRRVKALNVIVIYTNGVTSVWQRLADQWFAGKKNATRMSRNRV